MPDKDKIIGGCKEVLRVIDPIAYVAAEALGGVIKKTSEIIAEGNIDKMASEADKQELRTKIAVDQAKIIQEIAIAKRIETADEVEIEEYYDNNIEGNLGLKGNDSGISVGASGSGKQVVKRVYKFKGYNEARADIYEQTVKDTLNIDSEKLNEDISENSEANQS